ncbi:MAG: YraN family protein [Syntrophaceae bacterium]|nr:YraN family protein [Syntrophaceae bacterium]
MRRPSDSKAASLSQKGALGEDLAAAHLKKAGYEILVRNYRCAAGEMDIIARDGDVLVFVEVKTRRSGTFGEPEESVGPAKQRRLTRISLQYLNRQGLQDEKCRFDVVSVKMESSGTRIEIFRDAFDGLW